jgi:hypothetical protein
MYACAHIASLSGTQNQNFSSLMRPIILLKTFLKMSCFQPQRFNGSSMWMLYAVAQFKKFDQSVRLFDILQIPSSCI